MAGVKGMKWGVRKAVDTVKTARAAEKQERTANTQAARSAGYSSVKRFSDRALLGGRAVRKIEKEIAESGDVKAVRAKTYAVGAAATAALMAAPAVGSLAKSALTNAAAARTAAAGAKATADLFANTSGLTSYRTASLVFDSASKTWR